MNWKYSCTSSKNLDSGVVSEILKLFCASFCELFYVNDGACQIADQQGLGRTAGRRPHAGSCPLCSDVGRSPSNGGGLGLGTGVSGPGGGGPGTVGLVAVYGRVYCWHHDRTARLLLLHRFYKCGPAAGLPAAALSPLWLQLHPSGFPRPSRNGSAMGRCIANVAALGKSEVSKATWARWSSALQNVHTASTTPAAPATSRH